MNIDFKEICAHSGDKRAAFEELICQLAQLEKYNDCIEFRRTGRGADGGVECYWITNSGYEICWQAKYFPDCLADSQWGEIEQSVKSAITNHPEMKEYIICVPLNRTDSRQKNKSGNLKQTEMVKWDQYVKKWTIMAKEKGVEVSFVYWGETEILSRLLLNNPSNEGIKNYFFGIHSLNLKTLNDIAEDSKMTLGERFSESDNIELDISNNFKAVANEQSWKNKFYEDLQINNDQQFSIDETTLLDSLVEINQQILIYNDQLEGFDIDFPSVECIDLIHESYVKLTKLVKDFLSQDNLRSKISELNQKKKEVDNQSEIRNISDEQDRFQNIERKMYRLDDSLYQISYFLKSTEFICYLYRIIFLDGAAGIGKSHLVCDMALKNLEKQIPTVFLLGQHYAGGNPIHFLKEKLGINNYTDAQALNMLNVMAEQYQSRFIIIIDAINEGVGRKQWRDYLIEFVTQIKKYTHIALVISYRTTFKELIIPKSLLEDEKIVKITHTGFSNLEEKAVDKYFFQRGLLVPTSPMLKPEFSNPLFLKTCCDALVKKGMKALPKGVEGFVDLFEFYLEAINDKVSINLGYRPSQNIVFTYVEKFIDKLFPDSFYSGISTQEAEDIAVKVCDKKRLLDLMIDEGLLSLDVYCFRQKRAEEVVRFTFERYSEHVVARQIIAQCSSRTDIEGLFATGGLINNLLIKKGLYENSGLISALSLYIAELFGCEFIEFMDKESLCDEEYYFLKYTFEDTILWRTPRGFSKKSYELLEMMGSKGFGPLIELAIEPNHPINIKYLESKLMDLSVADRDYIWSIYIAEEAELDSTSFSLCKLINWFQTSDSGQIEKERLELFAITMIWVMSTSNRYIRDISTKLLAKVFFIRQDMVVPFLRKYSVVNDMYIVERLYAAVFGALVYIRDKMVVECIAKEVYEIQLKDKSPAVNIMVREYALLIIQYAQSLGVLTAEEIILKCKHPFISSWPIDIPSEEELNVKEEVWGLWNSLYGLGDFQKYNMGCVKDWSNTPINAEKFISGSMLQEQLLQKIKGLDYSLFQEYLTLHREKDQLYDIAIEQGVSHIDILLSRYNGEENKSLDEFLEKDQILDDKIESIQDMILTQFSDSDKFTFEEIIRHDKDKAIEFDVDIASRYIHQKVLELGWKNSYFKTFDTNYSFDYSRSSKDKRVERIGKKYQWIGFFELLALLADNFKWIPRGYADLEDEEYNSAIQISQRDIDPTMWFGGRPEEEVYNREKAGSWWELEQFEFSHSLKLSPTEWIERETILPDFSRLLCVKSNKEWIVLRGYSDYNQNVDVKTNANGQREELWFRVNSVIIPRKRRKEFLEVLQEKRLESPDTFSPPSFTSEIFYGEFHWHPYFQKLDISKEANMWKSDDIHFNIHIPTFQYCWERNADDHSLISSINSYLPSPVLVEEMGLHNNPMSYGVWLNADDEVVFQDPSVSEMGQNYALIDSQYLSKWLKDNDLEIIWLVGGEKQLHHPKHKRHTFGVAGRYTFNFAYAMDGENIIQIYSKSYLEMQSED